MKRDAARIEILSLALQAIAQELNPNTALAVARNLRSASEALAAKVADPDIDAAMAGELQRLLSTLSRAGAESHQQGDVCASRHG